MRIIAILIRSAAEPWIGELAADALAERADVEVPVAQLGDVAAALEDASPRSRARARTRPAIEVRAHAARSARSSVSMNSFASACVILSCRESACGALPVDRREVDRLRARAHLARHLGQRHVEDDAPPSGGGCRRPPGTPARTPGRPTGARAAAARSASSRRRAASIPSRGTKPRRMSRPSSRRIGMFWRFGSLDDSRPVAATVWLNDVWSRPSRGFTQRRQRVDVRALELGELAVLHQQHGQLVPLLGQLLQHARVRATGRSPSS